MGYRSSFDDEFEGLRKRLESVAPLPIENQSERRKKALRDYRFFCETYFPHLLTCAPSLLHDWIYKRVSKWKPGSKDLIAAPRGNAKTTHFSRLYPLWRIAKGNSKYIILFADTTAQAEADLQAVKIELVNNDRLAFDFPKVCGQGPVWQNDNFVTKNSIKMEAYGTGKSVLGANFAGNRPDLVVLNGLGNEENVNSPKQRDKTMRWIENTVLPLGPPDGSMQVIYTGTVKHEDSAMIRVRDRGDFAFKKFKAILQYPDRMDLWGQWQEVWKRDPSEGKLDALDFYERNREVMEVGGRVLWPQMQPLYKLMCIRAASPRSFASEYQNEPSVSAETVFSAIHYYEEIPGKSTAVRYYAGVDPALGKTRSDFTAIVVVGVAEDRRVYVAEADIGRYPPLQTVEKIIDLHRKYNCMKWGMETVAYQEALREFLLRDALALGIRIPVVPISTKGGQAAKEVRIDSLGPYVNSGIIRFKKQHVLLTEQLVQYGTGAHDDGPDALHIAFSIANRGGTLKFKTTAPPTRGF